MKASFSATSKFYFVFLFILSGLHASGQIENSMMATSKMTSHAKENRKSKKIKTPEVYRPIGIVVTDIRNIGYGNRCVGEATQRMGFVYVPMPIQAIEQKSRFYYFIHNQAARFKVTLKNGPFWQKKLKKSIKQCRQTTGDFTG